MNFQQLVNEFISGATYGVSGESLKIVDEQLIHFRTPIAERYNGKFIVNVSKYSVQTGRLQKIIKESIPSDLVIEVERVMRDYKGSLILVIK